MSEPKPTKYRYHCDECTQESCPTPYGFDIADAEQEKIEHTWKEIVRKLAVELDALMVQVKMMREKIDDFAQTGCGMSHPEDYACCLAESGIPVEACEFLREIKK